MNRLTGFIKKLMTMNGPIPFDGLSGTSEFDYNQRHLETDVYGATGPNNLKWDYCFVYSLCCWYYIHAKKPWTCIADALKQVELKFFDPHDGFVKSISGLTKQLSFALNCDFYIDRIAMLNGNDSTKEANAIIKSLKLCPTEFFLMARWSDPMHYTYVDAFGYEKQPFPGYSGKFYGWRIYKIVKIA